MKPGSSPAIRTELRSVRWLNPHRLQIAGSAYPRQKLPDGPHLIEALWLEGESGMRISGQHVPVVDALANARSKDPSFDVSRGAFVAVFDFWKLGRYLPKSSEAFVLRVSVSNGHSSITAGFLDRYRWGSARTLAAGEPFHDRLITPTWSDECGLQIFFKQPSALVTSIQYVEPARLRLGLQTISSLNPTEVVLATDEGEERKASEFEFRDNRCEVLFDLEGLEEVASGEERAWMVRLSGAGKNRLAHVSRAMLDQAASSIRSTFRLHRGAYGVFRLSWYPKRLVEALDAEFSNVASPGITVRCSVRGLNPKKLRPVAVGSRSTSDGHLIHSSENEAVFFFPLSSEEAPGSLTLPSGGYRLGIQPREGTKLLFLTPSPTLQEKLPRYYHCGEVNARIESTPKDELYCDVSAPLCDDELGAYAQAQLAKRFADMRQVEPDVFYFESWFGKSCSDNPLAICEAVKARLPQARLYFGVMDHSVGVPPGVTRLLIGSKDWWRIVQSAAFHVNNSWFRSTLTKIPGQRWIQTWHGTPLKRLGVDRTDVPGRSSRLGKIANDANRWDLLISQNPHSSDAFRRAYGYEGPIAEIGYPRTDLLFEPGQPFRELVRKSLGIAPEVKLILYAPTWREHDRGAADFLNVRELIERLPEDYWVLLRGHSITLATGSAVSGGRIIDGTAYPDAGPLMLASDLLVTDYSSIMFDYSVTRKPILFFTPDWSQYAEQDDGRGVYFDFREKAPGPICVKPDEVVARLREYPAWCAEYSQRYEAWRQEFNPWENGKAADAIVDRMLAMTDSKLHE